MNLTKPGEKACAFPGCKTPVTPDDHCAGCNFYVCDAHSSNINAGGHGHDVVEHWTPEDEDED